MLSMLSNSPSNRFTYDFSYYNSRFDVSDNINAVYPPGMLANESYDYITDAAAHLQKVATTVAKTLYELSTGSTNSSHVMVDNKTVSAQITRQLISSLRKTRLLLILTLKR